MLKCKKRRFLAVLSMVLSLVLLFQSVPVVAPLRASAMLSAGQMQDIAVEEATIISERSELRTEFEKHFVLSDGTYMAVAYADPVHEQLSDGSWQEIDNTLSLADGRYQNSALNFKASFSANAVSDNLVSIESKEYDLSWSLTILKSNFGHEVMSTGSVAARTAGSADVQAVQPALSVASVENPDRVAFSAMTNAQKIESAVSSSKVTYANAFGSGISVEYGVRSYAVKENVVLQNANTGFRGYTMHVSSEGLYAQIDEYNTITFIDADGNLQFTIQAPYMMDADDNVSGDIVVTLIETAEGYDITYIPDGSWLAAAAYPVVIDPQATSSQDASNLLDTYTYEGDSLSNAVTRQNQDRMFIGNRSVSGTRVKHIGYFKFINLPTIPSGYAFQSAAAVLKCPNGTNTSQPFDLYLVSSEWVTTNLCWSNKPDVSYLLCIAANRNTSTDIVYFSGLNTNRLLSNAVGNWYNGSQANYGFMVCYTSASENVADYNALYTSNCSTTSVRPYLAVNYELAESAVSNGIYYIQNEGTGKYLTVLNNGASQSNVVTQSDAGTPSQKWIVERLSDGNYKLRPLVNPDVRLLNDAGRIIDGNNISVHSGYYGLSMEFSITCNIDANGYPEATRFRIGTRSTGSNSYVADTGTNVVQKNYAYSDNQVWKFVQTASSISIPTEYQTYVGTVSTLPVTYYPASATGQSITWSSSNTSVATVNGSGTITGVGSGKCTVTASTNNGQTAVCEVTVGILGLDAFNTLLEDNYIHGADIVNTNDGFYMITKSLGDILISGGVSYLIDGSNEKNWCNNYYDDWYIYAVFVDNEYIYGLTKMREK